MTVHHHALMQQEVVVSSAFSVREKTGNLRGWLLSVTTMIDYYTAGKYCNNNISYLCICMAALIVLYFKIENNSQCHSKLCCCIVSVLVNHISPTSVFKNSISATDAISICISVHIGSSHRISGGAGKWIREPTWVVEIVILWKKPCLLFLTSGVMVCRRVLEALRLYFTVFYLINSESLLFY